MKSHNRPEKKQTEPKEKDHQGRPEAHLPSGNSGLLERSQKAEGHDPGQNQADHRAQHPQDAGENDVIARWAGIVHAPQFNQGFRTGSRDRKEFRSEYQGKPRQSAEGFERLCDEKGRLPAEPPKSG